MYRRMYTYQGPTVFHYQMWSTNASRAVSPMPRSRIGDRAQGRLPHAFAATAFAVAYHVPWSVGRCSKRTYHSDMHLPWDSLQAALEQVVSTAGRRARYQFRRFPY